MTVEIFMTLLTICSVLSSLLTEAVKKTIGNTGSLPWNIVVLLTSMIVGVSATGIYYSVANIQVTYIYVIYMFLMGIANWVCAMVGYDKVKQAITQING